MRLLSHILTTRANLAPKSYRKIKIMQNKWIRFCLRLDKMQHISLTQFRLINWLPTKERVHQCINALTFKFVDNNCPFYLNEIFEFALPCWINTKNNFTVLTYLTSLIVRLITRGRKRYRTLVTLCGTIYANPLKKQTI